MYITSMDDHIGKLKSIRAYLCDNAPRDSSGDLIPPFDDWVHRLEVAISRAANIRALLNRASCGENVIMDGKKNQEDQT